ncbi:MAG: DUF3783 domain-containing protein [Peptococcaceae bacterium]|nr:DUF3783 domain-containing protein [Peptococcaceae bacterium]
MTVADRCGEAVCRITERDLEKTVAECLETLVPIDMKAFQVEKQQEGTPFLLMDIDDLEIDPFLEQLRKHKVRIGHKCMVTEKNRQWKVQKLIGDVAEEHAMMTQLVTLQQMLEAAKDFKQEDYNPLLWMTFTQKKQAAQDLLDHVGKAPISIEAIQTMTKDLNQAVMALIVSRGGHS